MGFYSTHIVPRFIDKALGTPAMQEGRNAVAAGLSGTVLEIGFGSGLNVASYPPEIELVYAVEPALTARKIAVPRIAASPIPIQYAGLHGETVALDDNDSSHTALRDQPSVIAKSRVRR